MNSNTDNTNPENTNQAWSSWGYNLVCAQIKDGNGADSSAKGDLTPLFEYVSGHETCFLEFKATPYKPKEKYSNENPYGYKPGETDDDYAWNVVKAIIALANTAGGAIVLGVTDKGHEPIKNIAKDLWSGNKWDKFSIELPDKIFRKSYDVISNSKNTSSLNLNRRQHQTITLDDTASAALNQLCDPICCYYQGNPIAVILVRAVQSRSHLIYAKVDDENGKSTDVLFVRKGGDVGKTIKRTGREIGYYTQPDEATYTASRSSAGFQSKFKAYWHNIPNIPDFFGRDDELKQLDRTFKSDDYTIPWIHGGPGIGKTAFIQKFIKTYCRENSASLFDIAFFLNAQSQTFAQAICQLGSYANKFKDFCGIELNGGSHSPLDDIFKSSSENHPQIFKSWAHELIKQLNTYAGPGEVLVVLDNVDNPSFLNDPQLKLLLNEAKGGCVRFCVTSRGLPDADEHIVTYQLPPLSEADALRLLSCKQSISGQEEEAAAKEIVQRLKYNAWAISHIATQLGNDPQQNPYIHKRDELRKKRSPLKLSGTDSGEGLKTLYAPSIARLKDNSICDDKTLPLFALSAWFPQDAIPANWLQATFERYLYYHPQKQLNNDAEHEDEWSRRIKTLIHEGLIHPLPGNKAYRSLAFGQDVLWTLPETYHVWKYAFETIKETVILNANDSGFFSRCYDLLINFIDSTVTQRSLAKPTQDIWRNNAEAVVKWIATEPKLGSLLRNAVSNFGENARINRICNSLSDIAETAYKAEKDKDEVARHYIFFLSIQKIIAAKWDSNPNTFKIISQKIRSTFDNLSQKSEGAEKEEAEILFAEGLISDAKQNAKLDHYAIVENDLDTALEIIQKHKNTHLKLLIKSYLEKAKIDLEFKQFDKVETSLSKIKKLARRASKMLPKDDLLLFCKEQLAYMYLCKSESTTGIRMRYLNHKARTQYSALIKELASLPDEAQTAPRSTLKLLLFKSHYFNSIAHLLRFEKLKDGNKKKEKFLHLAECELQKAFKMCDDVFCPTTDDDNATISFLRFNKLRIKAGILRLCNQQEEAQVYDRKAFTYYEGTITDEANLENLEIADLEDDYGNTYALLDNFEKAIAHLRTALSIREKRLPPTHVKIRNSNSRLAYLYGIHAMHFGNLAHEEIIKLIDDNGHSKDTDRLRASSETLLKKLKKITEFEKESRAQFLDQLRKDEQKEESERVRTVIAELQEKLFDKWVKDHPANQ